MIRLINHYFLSFLLLLFFTACSPLEIKHTSVLVIENFQTGERLWESHIREGDIIHYDYVHSVYRDRVRQTYRVSGKGHFILIKVTSTPRVLSLPYPGFERPLSLEESNKVSVEIEMHIVQQQVIVVVGGEYTDNRLTVGQQSFGFRSLVGDGAIIRMYIDEK
jgi:hypothetical protein